jgi:hypothetical protein
MIDYQERFSDAQAITVDAASTNYIDTQVAGRAYDEQWLEVMVNTTFDTTGEEGTLVVKLQTDSASTFDSPATDLYTSASFAESVLVAGTKLIQMRLPEGLERYIRLYFDVNNSDAFTAGKVDAYLTGAPRLS